MTTEAERILGQAGSVLLVDWPSRDVPDTLTNAGYVEPYSKLQLIEKKNNARAASNASRYVV
jgi:hypothetical protein